MREHQPHLGPTLALAISRRREIVLFSLTILFTLMVVVIPGGGLIDLIDGFEPNLGPHLSRFVDLNNGIIAAIIVPAGLLTQFQTRRRRPAGLQQVAAAALAVAVAGLLGANYLALVEATVIAGFVAVLVDVDPARRRAAAFGRGPDRLLFGLAVAGAVPLAPYALAMILAERAGRSPLAAEDFGSPLGLQGWASLAAVALAIIFLALLAAWRTEGRHVTAWTAGVAAVTLGLASARYPGDPGSLGRGWGGLSVAAGLLYVASYEWRARRLAKV